MHPVIIGSIVASGAVGLSYIDGKFNEKRKTKKDFVVLFLFMLSVGSLCAYIYYNYSDVSFSSIASNAGNAGGSSSYADNAGDISTENVIGDGKIITDTIDTGLPDF